MSVRLRGYLVRHGLSWVAVMAGVVCVRSGIVAAARPGSLADRALMLGALLGVCVPGFWLSLNFIYLFAVRLGWLPAAGFFFFSSRRRHTRSDRDWSSDVCSSD